MKWIFYIFLFYHFFGISQETITLQNSIDKVLANDLHFTQQNSAIKTAEINRKFHPWSILPNMNASTNISTSFGRRVDPFTNTFTASQVNSQSIGLTSSMPLFNGFNYFHQKQLFNQTILQSEIVLGQKQNEIILSTIDEFLELCHLQIQLELIQLRIEHYKKIQQSQKLLIREGKISAIDTLKSHNSILDEQLQLSTINAQFSLKTIHLNFKMNVPLTTVYSYSISSIGNLQTKPAITDEMQLKLLEINAKIATSELKSAHTQNLPNIALSGNLGTGFSTNNKDYTITGNPTKPYRDQVNQNLYEGVGVYLNVPIFNRGTWLKQTQINKVKLHEIEQSKEFSQSNLEISKIENEQQVLNKAQEIIILGNIVNNLETIYSKTNLLYEEGRANYIELESSYLDWEVKKLELALTKLEYNKRKIFLN